MVLSTDQKVQIVFWYAQTSNASATAKKHNFTVSRTQQISHSTVTRLIEKFKTTGSVLNIKRDGPQKQYTDEATTSAIQESLDRSPEKSARRRSNELNMAHTTLRRYLKEKGVHVYHPRIVQQLSDGDSDHRNQHAEWQIAKTEADPNWPMDVCWSDEAIFRLNGDIHRHNTVYYAERKPDNYVYQRSMDKRSIMVWAAMCGRRIVGPVFLHEHVNQITYLAMLREKLLPIAGGWENFDRMHFQQDGAPAHYALAVRSFLDEEFSGRWIGRRGPVEWPPRSPDLTPPDFFLWGTLKPRVFAELHKIENKQRTIPRLMEIITKEFDVLRADEEMMERVVRSVPRRMQECLDNNGEHLKR